MANGERLGTNEKLTRLNELVDWVKKSGVNANINDDQVIELINGLEPIRNSNEEISQWDLSIKNGRVDLELLPDRRLGVMVWEENGNSGEVRLSMSIDELSSTKFNGETVLELKDREHGCVCVLSKSGYYVHFVEKD
jgi:hypothetical protein